MKEGEEQTRKRERGTGIERGRKGIKRRIKSRRKRRMRSRMRRKKRMRNRNCGRKNRI